MQHLGGRYTGTLNPADEQHFGQEFLALKLSIKTVSGLDEALDHIHQHSSKHSEAIVAEDPAVIEKFLNSVDAAAVYANASTAFTDGGQFGMGAEIGISTQKLHARGPMALPELTSYKWVVRGSGQIRPALNQLMAKVMVFQHVSGGATRHARSHAQKQGTPDSLC